MANTGIHYPTAGTTLTLTDSADANVGLFNDGTDNKLRVTNVDISGLQRESLEITGVEETGGRRYRPTGSHDPGTLTIEVVIDLDLLATDSSIRDALYNSTELHHMKLQFPASPDTSDTTGPALEGDGFFTNGLNLSGPLHGLYTATLEWKFDDDWTWTQAS